MFLSKHRMEESARRAYVVFSPIPVVFSEAFLTTLRKGRDGRSLIFERPPPLFFYLFFFSYSWLQQEVVSERKTSTTTGQDTPRSHTGHVARMRVGCKWRAPVDTVSFFRRYPVVYAAVPEGVRSLPWRFLSHDTTAEYYKKIEK